ncbi:phage holin family protein [Flavobacterium sp.]|uniref:phage holin family protein n=1 Tax=Flavobacterium sp. TaxID=239 RepID=UPI002B4B53A7|nr:phage holin family protein [Flavobacterium sp.]HLP65799.1 phage holin family protein [Flavobacterium sp.]
MNVLLRILITSVLVMLISHLMKESVIVDKFSTALIVAIVLGLLNFFVKPILVLFTLPITILTLGLFYLIINAIIVLLCDKLVDGFNVTSIWSALLFSIILSISQSLVYKVTETKK